MTRFLCAENGDLINADRIVRIEADGEQRCKATLDDYKTVGLLGSLDRMDRQLGPVIAAAPGYTALDYYEDSDGDPTVGRMPVVAWQLAEGLVTPITPADDDASNPSVEIPILLPDGRIVQLRDQIFPNEDSWREEMAKRAKSRREQESARPKPRLV